MQKVINPKTVKTVIRCRNFMRQQLDRIQKNVSFYVAQTVWETTFNGCFNIDFAVYGKNDTNENFKKHQKFKKDIFFNSTYRVKSFIPFCEQFKETVDKILEKNE